MWVEKGIFTSLTAADVEYEVDKRPNEEWHTGTTTALLALNGKAKKFKLMVSLIISTTDDRNSFW